MSWALSQLEGRARSLECRRHDEEFARAARTFTRAARMVTTPAGITIGIAYQPRPQPMGSHAEAIQTALLAPETAPSVWLRLVQLIRRRQA